MSTDIAQRLREMRKAEGLTQQEFADLVGLKLGSVKNYESGHSSVGLRVVESVLRHARFRQYTLWVMLGEASPEAGQLKP